MTQGEGHAFYNCYEMTAAYIPASVEIIEAEAFEYWRDTTCTPMRPVFKCGAEALPAGWDAKWKSELMAEPTWGVTLA